MEALSPAQKNQKRLIAWLLVLAIASTLVGTFYGILAVMGKVTATLPILFTLCWVAFVPTVVLSFFFWKNKNLFSLKIQVLFMLWGGVALWYWSLAPIYQVLNQTVNSQQIAVLILAYLWEVPGVGGAIFGYMGYRWFRPFSDYYADKIKPADPEKFYRAMLRFPIIIIFWTFFCSTFAYIVGVVQQILFGEMATVELVKLMLNGVALASFQFIMYYLLLDLMLNQVRKKLAKEYPSLKIVRGSLTKKAVGGSISIALGTIILASLIAFHAFQDIVRENTKIRMVDLMEVTQERFSTTQSSEDEIRALQSFKYGNQGRVIILPLDGVKTFSEFSPETAYFIVTHEEGFVQDVRGGIKLVFFFRTPDNARVAISIVNLVEFYGTITDSISFFALGIILVLVISVLGSFFISIIFTRSIRSLSQSIHRIKPGSLTPPEILHTGDDIQELSQALSNYVEQVQNIERAKNDFILLASHQLRTPPTIIKGSADMLLQQNSENLRPDQKEHIERIYRNNDRVVDLINTLLDVSSMELGMLAVELAPTNPVLIVKSILDELGNEVAKNNIKVEEKYGAEIREISADARLLRIVLHNLISNAIHYTPSGGIIGIETAQVRPEVLAGNTLSQENLVITIRNTGLGISKRDQEKIFIKFFRAEVAKKQNTRGTGLGLYMAKSIMDHVGGNLWFESKEGEGATFYVAIPLTGMKPAEEKHAQS